MVELHRIHGPPGCGKTSQVAAWAARACERFGPERVALCSMTRTAAHEIRSRGLPVPAENVGTLHALCHRALGRPPLYLDHVADWNARHPRLALSGAADIEDGDGDGLVRTAVGDELESKLALMRARVIPQGLWPADVRQFSNAWEEWKSDLGVSDFTDLIEDAYEADVAPPGNAAVLFVDEAQDLSALEHRLVRRWAESTDFTVICGDADQSLYGWRGGDPEVFLRPLPEGPGAEHPLTQSYRVPESVRAHAARWIERCSERYPVEYRARRDKQGSVVNGALLRASVSLKQDALVALIERELDRIEGPVMLLASCAYMLTPAIATLRQAGIPFHCPYRVKQGAWNPMRGAPRRLADALAPAFVPGWEEPRLWTARELWSLLEQCDAKSTVKRGMKGLLESAAKQEDKSGQGVPLSAEEVAAFMLDEPRAALIDAVRSRSEDVPKKLTAWLRSNLAATHASKWGYAIEIMRRAGISSLVDVPRLVIGTCHAVKGGEAESVILSPDGSPAAARAWNAGGRAQDDVRRTFYVGMTRTWSRLTVLASANGYPGALPI